MRRLLTGTVLSAVLAAGLLGNAHATVITFTGSGSDSDGSLSASATITTGNNTIQVVLNDTNSSIHSQGQALSGIIFTLSNAPGTLSNFVQSGQLGNVPSSNGAQTLSSGSPNHFGFGSTTGNKITIETAGTFAVGGQPRDMIIASGSTSGGVTNGFDNFDPYIIGPGTFTLSATGVTSSTTIAAVTFLFGTGPDSSVTGTDAPPVPEPASLALFGVGLLGLGFVTAKRRN